VSNSTQPAPSIARALKILSGSVQGYRRLIAGEGIPVKDPDVFEGSGVQKG